VVVSLEGRTVGAASEFGNRALVFIILRLPFEPAPPRSFPRGTHGPVHVEGYLAHEKSPTPLGHPQDPRHRSTVGSQGVAFSYERGTPVVPGLPACAAEAIPFLHLWHLRH